MLGRMADITTVDKVVRLSKIQELVDDGKDETEISKELDIPISTVRKNVKLLDEISVVELSPTERGKRRSALYIELQEAADEAKELFRTNSQDKNTQAARSYFKSWLETIEVRMRLLGLEGPSNKVNNMTQINQYMNPVLPDRVSKVVGDRIAGLLKKEHEEKVK